MLALSTCQEPVQLIGQGFVLLHACRAHGSVMQGKTVSNDMHIEVFHGTILKAL
jgi:hypothetical protein